MTTDQFAEKIKTKYPEYQALNNQELTQRIIKKYPQYATQVDGYAPKSFLNKTGSFLGSEKLGQGVGQALALKGSSKSFDESQQNAVSVQGDLLKRIKEKKTLGQDTTRLEKALQEQNKVVGGVSESASTVLNPNALTDRQVVGSAVQTAANFIPGAAKGASLAEKVAVGAGTGYAFDVGSNLQNTDKTTTESLTPGVGTIVGAVLPVAGALVGKLTEKGTKSLANNLERSNLRLTPKDKTFINKKEGFIDWLSSKKLTGNPAQRLEKIDTIYNEMENKVQEVLKKGNLKINKEQFIDAVKDIPEQFIDDPQLFDQSTNMVEKLIETAKTKYADEIPLEFVNQVKRNYGKRAFDKAAQQVVNDASYEISQNLSDLVTNSAPGLKPLNEEYSKIILARKLLNKAVGRSQLGLLGKIASSAVGGTIGGAVGGPIGAGVGLIAGEKIAENVAGTKSKSFIASQARSLYEKVTSLPTKGGKVQISKKLLLNLIETLKT